METVLLVVHLLLAVALIGVILLQRSEGGGLGIGGGGGSSAGAGFGGMMSARGTANFLTRTTAILAASFMATSLLLAIIASDGQDTDFLDQIEGAEVFNDIRTDDPAAIEPPEDTEPAVDAGPEVPLSE
ncbi:MAG: preprotein translocase subunit SecG [Alphaproteobacteria bacterium]|nr:preprotein translocase subunit SecG [Alphaproteobacteria bacterium SS10]MBV6634269.1 preprotein translocase subunit SecG [Alphaproteobacteria bacterium SS10]